MTILESLSYTHLAIGLVAYNVIKPLYGLHVNRKKAIATGLPYVYTAVYEWSMIWLLVKEIAWPILRALRLGWLVKYSRPSWNFDAKNKVHEELGDIFCVVSPGGLSIFVGDPDVICEVTKKRTKFPRPVKSFVKVMGYFGPSILSSEHDEWRFHRRVTNKTFTEPNHKVVWFDSLYQASAMRDEWLSGLDNITSNKEGIIHKMGSDCMKLALHVVTLASFGVQIPWTAQKEAVPAGYEMSFREASEFFLEHIAIMAYCPQWLYKYGPKLAQTAGVAAKNMRRHMMELIQIEDEKLQNGEDGKNLLSAMLQSDDPEAQAKGGSAYDTASVSKTGVRKDFVMGNSAIFLLAGHETSARSLEYALFLFAMHPEAQEEIFEEIDGILEGVGNIYDLKYEEVFPKMVKTNGVLYEATRLFPVTPYIPKSTEDVVDSWFIYKDQRVDIPPESMVALNAIGVHYNERYWPEPYKFKPSRWYQSQKQESLGISPQDTLQLSGSNTDAARLYRRGTYLGFGEGPRNCPGKRFAQVEIMATFLALFREHRMELVLEPGETHRDAFDRAWAALQRSRMVITLNLFEEIKVKLVPRK